MGVIIRQSLKNAFVSYAAIILGALNIIIIFPLSFSKEQLGIYQFVLSNAVTFYPFVMLGVNALVIRFFSDFKDENNGHNGFLTLLLSLGASGFFLFLLLSLFIGDYILGFYADKSILFKAYLPYFLPLLLLSGFEYIIATFCANFNRIAVPAFFTNFFTKLFSGALALLVYWRYLDFSQFINGIVLTHFAAVCGLLLYTYKLGQLHWSFKWKFISPILRKSMATYAFFGILGSLSSLLAVRLDMFMVGTLIDLNFTAIFSVAMYIAEVLDIPRRSIEGISAPIVANAWKEDNIQEIANIYRKSALNQFLAGWFMFVGIWACIDQVFLIMPKGDLYNSGKYVVFILGMGRMIDLITGVNHIIIGYSKYYKFNFYVILILGVLNIIGNLIFIPKMGINGAALATALSLGVYNILKLIFIYVKYHIQPFSAKMAGVFIVGIFAYFFVFVISNNINPWLNIFLKASIITIVFTAATLIFQLSPDAVQLARTVFNRIIKIIKN